MRLRKTIRKGIEYTLILRQEIAIGLQFDTFSKKVSIFTWKLVVYQAGVSRLSPETIPRKISDAII